LSVSAKGTASKSTESPEVKPLISTPSLVPLLRRTYSPALLEVMSISPPLAGAASVADPSPANLSVSPVAKPEIACGK
jgi:hypothetical protein